MELFDFILKKSSGKSTLLDKEYRKLIKDVVTLSDEEDSTRWEVYNLIIRELFNVDDGKYFQEIKYRFTDGENPNLVMLDIISRYKNDELSGLVWVLKRRVEEYADEDFFKRFYK